MSPPLADDCEEQDSCSPDPNCTAESYDGCQPAKDFKDSSGDMEATEGSCFNTGGADPIILSSRAAITDPFSDFTFEGPFPLRFARSYRSNDASVVKGAAPGAFGRGWRHQWEGTLKCQPATSVGNAGLSAGICSVTLGYAEATRFTMSGLSVFSPEFGETVQYYFSSADPLSVIVKQSRMIGRPNGDFVVYYDDGRKATFGTVCESCGSSANAFCTAPMQGGIARLKSLEDARGNVVDVAYDIAAGTLISVSDAWGHEIALKTPTSCSDSLARSLEFRASPSDTFTKLVDYAYVSTDLQSATDADGSIIRAYEYSSPGYLSKVKSEAGDPIIEFGYDGSGHANRIVDASTTLDVAYPEPNLTSTTHFSSTTPSSSNTSHGSGGRASSVAGRSINVLAYYKQRLACLDDGSTIVWRDFDDYLRVARVARYTKPPAFTCGVSAVPAAQFLLNEEFYSYGLSRLIGTNPTNGTSMTMPLKIVSRVSSRSLLQDGGFAGETTEYYDSDREQSWHGAPGDPSGYTCGPATLKTGSVVCRRIADGYTTTETGAIVYERHATFYSYDARARLVKTIGPINLDRPSPSDVSPIEERTYWPDAETGARAGRIKEIKRYAQPTASPLVFTIDYDMFGPYTVTDPDNRTAMYLRDGRGRVTTRQGWDQRQVRIRYYDGTSPRLVLFESGATRRAGYDQRGRLKSFERIYGDPDTAPELVSVGDKLEVQYDAAGNPMLAERKDSSGATRWKRIREYDADHRIQNETHPDDPTVKAIWNYDDSGILTSMLDEQGRSVEFVPGVLGLPSGVIRRTPPSALPRVATTVASYAYEADFAAFASVTDGEGRTTSYQHDDFGRNGRVESPSFKNGAAYRYEYDARGNPLVRTGGGATVTYAYDGMNRLVSISASSTTGAPSVDASLSYDAAGQRGRLWTISDAGRTTSFAWDAEGRLRYETVTVAGESANRVTEYRYDIDGWLDTVVYSSGLTLSHERDDRTKEVVAVREEGTGRPFISGVEREPFGPVKAATFGNGLPLTQTFNLRYEPDTIASGPLALSFGMGTAGDIDGVFEGSNPTGFVYDHLDRLTVVQPGPATAESLRYEYSGDRLVAAWTTGVPQVRRFAFGYDDQSNLSSVSKYDAAGTSIAQTVCLVHDALGRLVLVGNGLPSSGGPDALGCRSSVEVTQVVAQFEYDAFNRRVSRQDASGRKTFFSFLPNGETLGEYERTGVPASPWSTLREYVWLDGRPVAQEEHPSAAERYTYAVHVSHIGQPRALTNQNGQTVWSATASPYGEVVETTVTDPASGRTVVTNLRLPGQYDERLLAGIGLQGPYYNWNRWYLPSVGRYLELDPIAKAGGFNGFYGPNWYGYAEGNPLKFVDPMGLAQCTYSINSGVLKCTPDDPTHQPVEIPVASGNNGGGTQCKNNVSCAPIADRGPIPPGKYCWDNSPPSTTPNGRRLFPEPGTETYGRGSFPFTFATHSCLNPFGPSTSGPFCSEGCITGLKPDILKLNGLIDSEPGSCVTVTP